MMGAYYYYDGLFVFDWQDTDGIPDDVKVFYKTV
jgi:hypothetical protein